MASCFKPAEHAESEFNLPGSVETLLDQDPSLKSDLDTILESLNQGHDKRVWVGVRLRPQAGADRVTAQKRRVMLKDASSRETSFFFNRAFDGSTSQAEIWGSIQAPLMRCMLRREHACLLAYGQTGSGKTHTMFGIPDSEEERGVAFRAIENLGRLLRSQAPDDVDSAPLLEFSFLEVYNEKVHDLLNGQQPCSLAGEREELEPGDQYHAPKFSAEERVVVKGLTRRSCDLSCLEQQVGQWLSEGAASRMVGRTVFNPRSSRSHAVATLHIGWRDQNPPKEARLYLVDLAGSERAGQYAIGANQLKEGVNINQSLSTLGRVVGALARGQGEHVPYRDSALTWLLSDAITGQNARAFMIAAVQPAHPAETLSTLRYAQAYSSLQSDLSTKIPKLKLQARALHRHMESTKNAFENLCFEINVNGRTSSHWNRQSVRQRMVKVRRGAEYFFKNHPYLRWTDTHDTKATLHMVGVVTAVLEVPPTRDPEDPADGRRLTHREVAEGEWWSASVQVQYAGRHGYHATLLWFPSDSLEDVLAPSRLRELLMAFEKAETAYLQKQEQLREAQHAFAAQQAEW
eukprot:CAMPEP_0197627366 /NCGR_PEP_ID=MMETSP1338-20131121/6003_1 /TAXON_ID=43686 ORGANISM="Pelagodinium beii, Strain RCC1491" /NCGR_SAMPLE_ID=MMETSP1338 /ASSEMBLY_ACC=CAM_ASM_000754 /LENGTH=574 /DNA_ID=CAMNT_0043198069 /DNA_START=101 /DNA_END=1823 /DNA_ORIENTATION=+